MAEKFNIMEYASRVPDIAAENKVSAEEAATLFITNLVVMREHYKGCSDLNYHDLGQKWNKLTSADKVQQKSEFIRYVSKHNKSGGRS